MNQKYFWFNQTFYNETNTQEYWKCYSHKQTNGAKDLCKIRYAISIMWVTLNFHKQTNGAKDLCKIWYAISIMWATLSFLQYNILSLSALIY